jgi:hypothetical protein
MALPARSGVKAGEEALLAIGDAYIEEMFDRPAPPPGTYARIRRKRRSRDPRGPSQVWGLSPERISSFLATGMLLSVLALMQVQDGAEHGGDATRRLHEDLSSLSA